MWVVPSRYALFSWRAAWGVVLHARAGERLAQRIGPLAYLARELPREIPRLMAAFSAPR